MGSCTTVLHSPGPRQAAKLSAGRSSPGTETSPSKHSNSFLRESQEKVSENNSDFVVSFPSREVLDVKDISPLGKCDGSFPLPEGNLAKDHHIPEIHLTSSPEFETYWSQIHGSSSPLFLRAASIFLLVTQKCFASAK